jgi:hypothetical protein
MCAMSSSTLASAPSISTAARQKTSATPRWHAWRPAREPVQEPVRQEMGRTNSLEHVGFAVGEYGQLTADGCKVTFYSVLDDWEVDIRSPPTEITSPMANAKLP